MQRGICKCGNRKSVVSDECSVCYLERLITYTASRQSVFDKVGLSGQLKDREDWEFSNQSIFDTSDK